MNPHLTLILHLPLSHCLVSPLGVICMFVVLTHYDLSLPSTSFLIVRHSSIESKGIPRSTRGANSISYSCYQHFQMESRRRESLLQGVLNKFASNNNITFEIFSK